MASYYPVYLDLKGRHCVVIGGGEVAERKVRTLLECSAKVSLVAPRLTTGLLELAQAEVVIWRRREYVPGDLDGAFLAIAATDEPSVNRKVAEEAEDHHILVNVVDMPALCNFIAPAIVKRGDVVLAISTGGLSPALARKLREELSQSAALRWADLADLLSEVRKALKERGIRVHPDRWQACLDNDVLDLVRDGRRQEAREHLVSQLEKQP